MYKKPNQKLVERFTERYQRAKEDGALKECVVGVDSEYRINSRDSYYSSISDPTVILEYVLYPQFIDGNTSVEDEIKNIIDKLAESEDTLFFFQAFMFISAEMELKKYFGEIPFSVVSDELIKVLKHRLSEMEEKLQAYDEGEFGMYKSTMLDVVQKIIET